MNKISVVMGVRNEETRNNVSRFRDALRSARAFADEILVLDDMSTDQTCEIALKEFGAKVIKHSLNKDFTQRSNMAMKLARNDWVFAMDPDEVIPSSMAQEILKMDLSGVSAVYFRRLNHIFDHPVHHAGATTILPRLRDRRRSYFPDIPGHPRLKVDGRTVLSEEMILHYKIDRISQAFEKIEFYTDIAAKEYLNDHATVSKKEIRYRLTWKLLKIFWKGYVKKSGSKDGIPGLVWCLLDVVYLMMLWMKIWASASKQSKLSG